MKKNKKVSIIIPVYNGMDFIDKCMDSVLNQTYKNIEIILSNDGSKDKSLDRIKEYAKKHKNVKFDSHENVGLSETRNIALRQATGDFVTYLDVDDYFDYDFIEKMIEGHEKYDVIIGGYRNIYPSGKINFEYSLSDSEWNRYKRVTVWARLYRLSFLKKNKIEFPHDRLYGEDVVYTMRCLSKTENVVITPYIGYNNLINEKSITHKNRNLISTEVPKMIKYVDEFIFKDTDFLIKKKHIVKYYYLKIFTAFLMEQTTFLTKEELQKYYKNSFPIVKNIFKKYGYKMNLIRMRDESFKVNLMIKLVIICDKLHLNKLLINLLHKVYYHE